MDALSARLGWDGAPPRTLEESARIIGVSRERIRQIQARLISKLPTHPVFMPALDGALATIAELAPIEAEQAGEILMIRGLSVVPFHPLSVLSAAGRVRSRRYIRSETRWQRKEGDNEW